MLYKVQNKRGKYEWHIISLSLSLSLSLSSTHAREKASSFSSRSLFHVVRLVFVHNDAHEAINVVAGNLNHTRIETVL